MSSEPKLSPPYVSYATFKNFLASIKELVPARIDSTHPFLMGQSGSAQSFLMQALRFLSLVDGKTPTPELKKLAQSDGEERQRVWKEIFTKAFHPVMGDIDLTTASAGMVHDKFRAQDLTGETVAKCFSFFVAGAEDAGIPMAKHLKPGSRTGGPRKPRKQRVNGATGTANQEQDLPPQAKTMHELLLAKFPQFDPNWPDELKAKWFDGYQRLLDAADAQE